MRKHYLKIFAMFLCLALLLTACEANIESEDSSEQDIVNSSDISSETSANNYAIPSLYDHMNWSGPLVWQKGYWTADSGYAQQGPFVNIALQRTDRDTLFCIGIHKREISLLDTKHIKYGPVSDSDFIANPFDPKEQETYVRAYVDKKELQSLIDNGCHVYITVPERPKGYPKKISDSLAFLLETSDWEEYNVFYYYTTCPRDQSHMGRLDFMKPDDPPNWYYWKERYPSEADEESEWYGSDYLSRDEIISLTKDPRIRSVFPLVGLCASELDKGVPTKKAEKIPLEI